MFRISIHTPEEIAHRLILFIQVVQVSFATITGFLHAGTTISSHCNWNLHLTWELRCIFNQKRNSVVLYSKKNTTVESSPLITIGLLRQYRAALRSQIFWLLKRKGRCPYPVADLEKLLGGAYSLHLLPIAIPFKLQWLQIHRRGSMNL